MGSKNTSCNTDTKTVIIECAHFDPEIVIGKSVKYSINSDAAYKFERNTDHGCHDYVMRRFLKIVNDHTNFVNIELFTQNQFPIDERKIHLDANKINNILGVNLKQQEIVRYLERLGFNTDDDYVHIPTYRNDISTINDLGEEVARAIGYDNIKPISFKINPNSIDKKSKRG